MRTYFLWLGIISLLLIGCQQKAETVDQPEDQSTSVELGSAEVPDAANVDTPEETAENTDSAESAENTETEEKTAEAGEVAVQILSWKETQKLVASHKGKVVVLDLWSTWCTPCVREFPNLVALHNKYGKEKIACISGSCDYDGLPDEPPEKVKPNVIKFLEKQKATFDNVLFSDEAEKVFEQADVASIPVVYVYGPDGKLVERFDNEDPDRFGGEEFNYEKHIIPLVDKLLTKE